VHSSSSCLFFFFLWLHKQNDDECVTHCHHLPLKKIKRTTTSCALVVVLPFCVALQRKQQQSTRSLSSSFLFVSPCKENNNEHATHCHLLVFLNLCFGKKKRTTMNVHLSTSFFFCFISPYKENNNKAHNTLSLSFKTYVSKKKNLMTSMCSSSSFFGGMPITFVLQQKASMCQDVEFFK
jgi:hypothetical protein